VRPEGSTNPTLFNATRKQVHISTENEAADLPEVLPKSIREAAGLLLMALVSMKAMGSRFISCRDKGTELIFVCEGCGNVQILPNSCKNRYCPRCNYSRRLALVERFGSADLWRNPLGLCLGIPAVRDLSPELISNIRACFGRLRRHKLFSKVRGGFYCIEVVRHVKTGLWAVHIHAVLDSAYLDREAIYSAWLSLTAHFGGETRNVWIYRAFYKEKGVRRYVLPRMRDRKAAVLKAVEYAVGYAFKSEGIYSDAQALADVINVTYRSRLAQGFGSLYDVPVESFRMICSECGSTRWRFEGFLGYLEWLSSTVLGHRVRRRYSMLGGDG
jgi:hypothetical protein